MRKETKKAIIATYARWMLDLSKMQPDCPIEGQSYHDSRLDVLERALEEFWEKMTDAGVDIRIRNKHNK